MEITKQNETFSLSDKTDNGWVISGSAVNNIDGTLTVNFNVNSEGGLNDSIGYYNIAVPKEGMINLSLSALPEYYDALTDYSQQALKTIQDYLNNQTIAN